MVEGAGRGEGVTLMPQGFLWGMKGPGSDRGEADAVL